MTSCSGVTTGVVPFNDVSKCAKVSMLLPPQFFVISFTFWVIF